MTRRCREITVEADCKLAKHPSDDRLYYMDFTPDMQEDDTLATVEDVAELETSFGDLTIDTAGAAVLAVATTVNGKAIEANRAATCRISGGAVDADGNAQEYRVTWQVTTAAGDTINKTGILVLTKKRGDA